MSRESPAEFCVTSWCKGDANRSFVVRKPGGQFLPPTCSRAALKAHGMPAPVERCSVALSIVIPVRAGPEIAVDGSPRLVRRRPNGMEGAPVHLVHA